MGHTFSVAHVDEHRVVPERNVYYIQSLRRLCLARVGFAESIKSFSEDEESQFASSVSRERYLAYDVHFWKDAFAFLEETQS